MASMAHITRRSIYHFFQYLDDGKQAALDINNESGAVELIYSVKRCQGALLVGSEPPPNPYWENWQRVVSCKSGKVILHDLG